MMGQLDIPSVALRPSLGRVAGGPRFGESRDREDQLDLHQLQALAVNMSWFLKTETGTKDIPIRYGKSRKAVQKVLGHCKGFDQRFVAHGCYSPPSQGCAAAHRQENHSGVFREDLASGFDSAMRPQHHGCPAMERHTGKGRVH